MIGKVVYLDIKLEQKFSATDTGLESNINKRESTRHLTNVPPVGRGRKPSRQGEFFTK